MNRMFSNKKIIQLIVPLLVEQLLVMIVGMLDTIMVSSVGDAAVSGVSLVNDVNNLIIALLSALAGGGAVCVSQYLGNNDDENTRFASSQLIMISFVISFVLCIGCLVGHASILRLLYPKIESDVMQAAKTYFWLTALSFPFLGLYNSGAAIYRSMNKAKYTMYVSVLVNMINLVGNYLGIMVFKIGVAGVALPTLVSRIAGAIVMMRLVYRKDNPIYVENKQIFRFNKFIVNKILTIAIPNSVENGLFQMGKIIVSTFVATYGTLQIAANGVTNSISVICYATEMAMQLAVVTIVGSTVGANDYEQTRYYIRKMIIWGWIMAIVNNAVVLFGHRFALSFYTISPQAHDIATTILVMECFAIAILHPLAFILPSSIRAAGDAKYTMYVGVTSMFLARCVGAYIFGTVLGFGVIGTRIGMYIDWAVRIVFFMWRYRSGKWMNYRLI